MLIKENVKNYSTSINFIDDLDNFVGYDMDRQCCEDFGWYITREAVGYDYDKENLSEVQEAELVGYRFDTTFVDNYDFDDTIVFRLYSSTGGVAYLHLYNCQNGYYSHIWESSMNGVEDKGYL